MNEETLKTYRTLKAELLSIDQELAELTVTDAVQTAAEPPYSKHTIAVSGLPPDPHVISLLWRKAELERAVKEIRGFVDGIPDEQMRYILREKYLHGRSNLYIAMKLGYRDETVVRRKIKKFFKKPKKPNLV